ncbi:MAG: hypothetical protein MJY99_06905 [Fibrobacter sp.]|nr:hypothetical protein [Fibrobacter sp.]
MRISYKVFFASLLFASLSFAGSECVNLCSSCQEKSDDATCKNVNSICQCKAVLDSAKAKNAMLEISKKKFIEDLSKSCDKTACAREFTFENGNYQKMEKGRTNLTREQLTANIRTTEQKNSLLTPTAIQEKQKELDGLMMQRTAIVAVKMTPECTSQCDACNAPSDSAKAKTATTDSAAVSATQTAADTTKPATIPADSATQATAQAAIPADSAAVHADSAAAQALATPPADSAAQANATAAITDSTATQTATTATPADTAKTAAIPADSAAQAQTTAIAAAAVDSITPLDSAALAARADSIARADSLFKATCARTEAICRCTEFKENARRLVELDSTIALRRQESDSLSKERPALIRADMATAIADTVHTLCDINGKCTFSVTFTSNGLALIELHKVEETAALPTQAPAATTTAADSAQQENCVQTSADSTAQTAQNGEKKDSTSSKDRIFYKAMEITFAQLTESEYFLKNYGRLPLEENKAIEGRVAYFLRWYFYDAGAISVGMGTTYRYNKFEQDESAKGKDDGYKIDYHSLAFDVPISVRLGVPKIPYVRPFVSETFAFSKPVYELALVRTDAKLNGKETKKFNYFANAPKDWEYYVWLGFGLELTRRVSLEYQMLLGSKKNGHAHIYDTDGSWRAVAGFAW